MGKKDKRIDAYIAKAADWQKPILVAIRAAVHDAAPDIEEDLKWGHPSFIQDGIVCGMASFKARVGLHFWKHALLAPNRELDPRLSKLSQLTSVKDLPSKKVLQGYIRKAVALNTAGVKLPKAPAKPKKPLVMPGYFMSAIAKNKKALATYQGFSPSHQREYVEWITGAKGDDTRDRRVAQAVEWMAEGKPRNWKYMR